MALSLSTASGDAHAELGVPLARSHHHHLRLLLPLWLQEGDFLRGDRCLAVASSWHRSWESEPGGWRLVKRTKRTDGGRPSPAEPGGWRLVKRTKRTDGGRPSPGVCSSSPAAGSPPHEDPGGALGVARGRAPGCWSRGWASHGTWPSARRGLEVSGESSPS
jgi:hypothetical protein